MPYWCGISVPFLSLFNPESKKQYLLSVCCMTSNVRGCIRYQQGVMKYSRQQKGYNLFGEKRYIHMNSEEISF